VKALAAGLAVLAVAAALLAHDLRAQREHGATVLPSAVSERALGLEPQRRLRAAIVLYERGRRREAASALEAATADGDARSVSQAYDLLGILTFPRSATQAVGELRQAVLLDPTNETAKRNLELALLRLRATGARPGAAAASGPRGGGRRGAGGAAAGGGY
jgi:hypothetical protein